MDIELKTNNRLSDFYKRNKSMLLSVIIIFFGVDVFLLLIGTIIGITIDNLIVTMSCAISTFVAGVFLFTFLRVKSLRV
ncbi:MAG: hypothetical protein KAS63_10725 [Candidatus Heimdallarchaeota archaeon]|nr:hypothetical protein [Candidatus Heimdallarchaeota archaeon]MCK4955829.1 hypothetical protein [Candidatus Heimdallarchaeota archaeon]